MNVSYSHPLSLGWNRMKKALFQPFDISKWFRIGFTAWLASLTDCSGGSGGNGEYGVKNGGDWDEFFNFPQTAQEWLLDNPLWFNLIIVGIVALFIIIAVLVWISSRGKFMFLYNVANEKSAIGHPWRQYNKEGNSLFVWNLFFGTFAVLTFLAFLFYCFITAKSLYFGDYPDIAIFWSIAGMVLMLFAYIIVFGYISTFVDHFVVPIMYKNRVGVITGWTMFLSLFFKRFFSFVIYGLFYFVLGIGIAIAVILFALLTCCIGLLLLAIPYIGAVVLLPISYTIRAFSLEFLAQFGDEFNVFPNNEATEDSVEIT